MQGFTEHIVTLQGNYLCVTSLAQCQVHSKHSIDGAAATGGIAIAVDGEEN